VEKPKEQSQRKETGYNHNQIPKVVVTQSILLKLIQKKSNEYRIEKIEDIGNNKESDVDEYILAISNRKTPHLAEEKSDWFLTDFFPRYHFIFVLN